MDVDAREAIRALQSLSKLGKGQHAQNALMQGGLILERQVKQNITSQGLIDTGKMRASVAALPDKANSVIVAVRTYYALFHEYGTRRIKARPFLRPAWDERKKDVVKAIVNYYVQQVKRL